MNTAKPSIPSGNGGAADDLIEELARLMAQGAQENSASAPPAAGNTPPTAKPELALANSPARNPFRPTQPSHQDTAPAGKPALKLESEAVKPGQPPASGVEEPRLKEQVFGQGAGRDPSDKPISGKPISANPMPANPISAKPVSALSASDRIAPEVKSTAPSDPIADLIRAQSAPEKDAGTGAGATKENPGGAEPQAVANPDAASQAADIQDAANGETAAEPRHGGSSDEKVSSQRGDLQPGDLQRRDKFRIPPVFGGPGIPGCCQTGGFYTSASQNK